MESISFFKKLCCSYALEHKLEIKWGWFVWLGFFKISGSLKAVCLLLLMPCSFQVSQFAEPRSLRQQALKEM